ncbi:MAG: hypothetical protein N4A64_07120 [Marinisporobacter sp.]|jgi:hypothetical protein|nr:hypothetical protein [Marinisporobacter sp.]
MTFIEIQKAVIEKIKESFPKYHFCESMQDKDLDQPAFFIQALPISTTMEDKYHQNKLMKIDIRYFSKSETMEENLKALEKLQEIFHPLLIVKNRKFTIQESKVSIVNKVLAFSFEIQFMDTVDERKLYDYQNYEKMQQLSMKEEK